MTQRKWNDVSVDLDHVVGTKLVGANGYNTYNHVFIDLYLTSGETIQIALDFSEAAKAYIQDQAGERPIEPTSVPAPPIKRWFENRASWAERSASWTKLSEEYHKAYRDYYQRKSVWWHTYEEAARVMSLEAYENFLREFDLDRSS